MVNQCVNISDARTVATVSSNLSLDKLRDRRWYVQGTCAMSGDGLVEGLEHFSQSVKDFQKQKKYMYS